MRDGETHVARTDGEVLLAAGAFVSPQLLMLSGIGPADQLRRFGIAVAADLPGVGEDLQDHAGAPLVAAAPGDYGYYRQDTGVRMILNGLEYLLFGRGRIATNGCEACSFHVPEDGTGDPVVQVWCVPKTSYVDKDVRDVPNIDGVTLHAVLMRPRARGWVRLRSADPKDLPLVNPNYLGHPDDVKHLREGMRVAREILATGPLSDIVREEIAARPGGDERRGDRRACPPHGEDRLPPGRHLPHGHERRPARGGRRAAPGARHRRAAGRRRLGDAEDRHRQHQRADHGARRPRRRPDAGRSIDPWRYQ